MHSLPLTQPSQSQGFTLLELLAVIAILAVLAAMVVPMLGNNGERDAADTAHRMVLLINQAREEAVMSARIWQVVLDPVDHSFRFLQITGNEFQDVTTAPFAGEHLLKNVTLEKLQINGQLQAVPGEIYLFPTGEQDAFRLVVRGGQREYQLAMGPIGEAEVVDL
jgi:type II secretion system protein H